MKNISLFIIIGAVSWLSIMETFAQSVPTLSTSVTNPSCGSASGYLYINQQNCNGCAVTKWEKGILSSPPSAENPHGIFTPQITLPPIANLQYSLTAGQAPVAYRAYYTPNGITEYTTYPIEIRADVIRSAGTLSGSATFYNVAPPVQLTLTGCSGTPQWLKTNDPNGSNWVATAMPSDNTVTVTESTWFQVKIDNGACGNAFTNVVGIQIFKTALLSGPASVSEGDRVTLTLTPQQAQPQPVIQWEYSTDGGNTWVIFDYNSYGRTISNDAFADTHRITGLTLFRVMVDAGPGGHPYTNTISVAYLPYTRYYANQVNGGNYVREQQVTIPGITMLNAVEGLATTQKHEVITYLDGVGRPLQQNICKASANAQNDIISTSAYDHQGRQTTQYLPYVSAGNDGAYRTNPLNEQWSFYSHGSDKMAYGPYPFAQTLYEKSPLGRVQAQGSVGPEFQLYNNQNTHTQRVGYYGNAANEVRMFKADGSSTDFYPANELSKIETLDADQKKTQTFTDKAGKTILTRVQLDDNININGISVNVPWLETYYIYNTAGAIKYIISPKGVYILQSGSWTLSPSILNQYVHQFNYDSFARLIEKKVPGQAWTYYCYDRLDRLVLAQDGTTGTNQWLFLKYDQKGRTVMQGLYTNTTYTTRASLQTNVVDPLYALDTDLYYEERGAAAHGYTNQSFPTSDTQIHAVNYYDDYDLNNDGTATPDVAYTPQSLAGENTPTDVTAGMPTASKRLVLDGGNTWLYRYAFYDRYGRVIQTVSNNHLSTAVDNITTMVYDFEGKVTLTKNYHNAGTGKQTTVVNTFWYDAGGRLKQVKQNNNNAGSDQLVAQYEYNELGQLVDKKLHSTDGTNFLQSIDYRYNLQGKLTSINNAQLTSDALTNDDTNDMFGMELLYQTTEAGLTTASDVSFNGNISAVKWKGAGATAGAADQKSYKFAFDKSNKLTNATSQLYDGSMWTKEAGALNENLTYDHNGNILTLQRNQRKNLLLYTYIAETIDNLTYNYNPALGDQLQKVTDAAGGTAEAGFYNGASGTSNDYVYDVNGNVIKDLNKGISNIIYNHLGKPTTINFSDGRHVDYVYDATGTKLTVKVYDTRNALKTTTDYVNGFVYENNTLKFFNSPEGRVVSNNGTLEYQYTITDHQGNTRVLFSSVNPTTPPITATFEDPAADAQKGFKNVPTNTMYWVPKSAANNTSSGQYVMRMNSTYNTGPAKSLSVFPGDVVNLEVWSYFEGSSGFGASNQSLNALITSVAGAFGGAPTPGEAGQIYGHVSNAYNIFGSPTNAGDGAPTAHLNYILFDRDYNPLDMGWKAVPTTANMSKQLVAFNPIAIKEAGFMYVYLSYGGDGTNWVYFDDLKITHTKTNVIQYNEYYPYRMQASTSWTREDNKNNLNTTGWYDLPFRNYDASLGRFMQVDPLATKYASFSSYHYSFNNPVMFSDPSGAAPGDGPMGPAGYTDSYGRWNWRPDIINPGPSDAGAARMYGEFLLSERFADEAYQRSKQREEGTPVDPSQYAKVLNEAKKGTLRVDNNGNWGYYETIFIDNPRSFVPSVITEYRRGSVGTSQTQGRSSALSGDIINRIMATQSKDGSFTGSATAMLQGDENAYIAGSTNAGMFNKPGDDVNKLFTQLKNINKNGNTLRMSAAGKVSYELQLGRSINEMNSLLGTSTPSLIIMGIDASGIETSFAESRLKEAIVALANNTNPVEKPSGPIVSLTIRYLENGIVVDTYYEQYIEINSSNQTISTGTLSFELDLNYDNGEYKIDYRDINVTDEYAALRKIIPAAKVYAMQFVKSSYQDKNEARKDIYKAIEESRKYIDTHVTSTKDVDNFVGSYDQTKQLEESVAKFKSEQGIDSKAVIVDKNIFEQLKNDYASGKLIPERDVTILMGKNDDGTYDKHIVYKDGVFNYPTQKVVTHDDGSQETIQLTGTQEEIDAIRDDHIDKAIANQTIDGIGIIGDPALNIQIKALWVIKVTKEALAEVKVPEPLWHKEQYPTDYPFGLQPVVGGLGDGVVEEVKSVPDLLMMGLSMFDEEETSKLFEFFKKFNFGTVKKMFKAKTDKYDPAHPEVMMHEGGHDAVQIASMFWGGAFIKGGKAAKTADEVDGIVNKVDDVLAKLPNQAVADKLATLSGKTQSKLVKDLADDPKLLDAVNSNGNFVDAWKKLDDAGVDAALRKDPLELDFVNKNLDKIEGAGGYNQWVSKTLKGGDDLFERIDEISKFVSDVNKKYSDGLEFTPGKLSAAINSASYYSKISEQGTAIFNSIVTGHIFNNGVKRTASDFISHFANGNGLKLKLDASGLQNLTTELATGTHYEIDQLTKILFE